MIVALDWSRRSRRALGMSRWRTRGLTIVQITGFAENENRAAALNCNGTQADFEGSVVFILLRTGRFPAAKSSAVIPAQGHFVCSRAWIDAEFQVSDLQSRWH